MNRRVFVTGLGAVLVVPLAAEAQQAGNAWRIGVLSAGTQQTAIGPQLLPKALRELGYIESVNLVIEWRFADGNVSRLSELVSDLIRFKVDVIVTGFNSEVLAARQATTTIPIVMIASWDPVGSGIVASLSRPGGNVTGMTIQPVEFAGKQVELLKQAVPGISRIAVLWDPSYPGFAAGYKHAEMVARALGFALHSIEVRQPSEIEPALTRIAQDRADGLAIWQTNFMVAHMPRILEFATQRRLPTMLPTTALMRPGVLMAYGVNQADQYRRTAAFIDKILKGAKPADLPVEQPTKFDLVINLKTAKALGLTIPPLLLLRADQVIE